MSNNEAPERIWLSDNQPAATWTDFQQIGYTEYIRADRVAELESRLRGSEDVNRYLMAERGALKAELAAERNKWRKPKWAQNITGPSTTAVDDQFREADERD